MNPADKPFETGDGVLFAVVVLSWSLSWFALSLQVGDVAVQTSLMWRFIIAAAVMLVWAKVAGEPMRFAARTHALFAALGLFIFCLNFILFYYGSIYLISGLLSVVFSLASVFNLVIASALDRRLPSARVAFGATLGVAGIALMFAPEIGGQDWSGGALLGLGLCVLGTLSFCTGNQVSARLQAAKISVVSASAWGMTYGAVLSGMMALALGRSLAPSTDPVWIGSLVFLAIVSSVVAFWAYLNLLGRIGSARAGYATVVFPVLALVVSALVEDYRFGVLSAVGLLCVLAGNVLVLGGGRRKVPAPQVQG